MQIIKFNSEVYLKKITLDKKLLNTLEKTKLTKYEINQNNYFDEHVDAVKTKMIGSFLKEHIYGILKKNFIIRKWWIQKYEKEDFHDLHIHGNKHNWFSFILYLKATSKSSKTTFYGPAHPLITWDGVDVQPEPGLFVLFPSYIPHVVGYNKDKQRLILSGNIECFNS